MNLWFYSCNSQLTLCNEWPVLTWCQPASQPFSQWTVESPVLFLLSSSSCINCKYSSVRAGEMAGQVLCGARTCSCNKFVIKWCIFDCWGQGKNNKLYYFNVQCFVKRACFLCIRWERHCFDLMMVLSLQVFEYNVYCVKICTFACRPYILYSRLSRQSELIVLPWWGVVPWPSLMSYLAAAGQGR